MINSISTQMLSLKSARIEFNIGNSSETRMQVDIDLTGIQFTAYPTQGNSISQTWMLHGDFQMIYSISKQFQ